MLPPCLLFFFFLFPIPHAYHRVFVSCTLYWTWGRYSNDYETIGFTTSIPWTNKQGDGWLATGKPSHTRDSNSSTLKTHYRPRVAASAIYHVFPFSHSSPVLPSLLSSTSPYSFFPRWHYYILSLIAQSVCIHQNKWQANQWIYLSDWWKWRCTVWKENISGINNQEEYWNIICTWQHHKEMHDAIHKFRVKSVHGEEYGLYQLTRLVNWI